MSSSKAKFDAGFIRDLAMILREADLNELEIEQDGLRIRVSKTAPQYVQSAHASAAPIITPAPVAAPQLTAPLSTLPAVAAIPEHAVKSLMVGTVYLSPEPGAKPFFSVGDKVKQGDTIMLVEAMKTFNPVEANRTGVLKAIYVTDSQPVEYGEALALIE